MTRRTRHVLLALWVVPLALAAGHRAAAAARRSPAEAPVQAPAASPAKAVALPNEKGSLKFAVLGDFGTGRPPEYQLAAQMAKLYEEFKLELVVLVGDNLYGAERPQDFRSKFEDPYKPLLEAGVKFYACLGNHDARAQRYYKPFNMDGKLYYSFKAPKEKVRFFVLDSTYPVPEQIDWIGKELKGSNDDWKIVYFHHPLYSSAARHGSDVKLREMLEPLFIEHNVSVVLTGHDHVYERVKPQHDIAYFVVGSGGQLRPGNLDKSSPITASAFDTDLAFMAVEISGDRMYFNTISREGRIVDSGIVQRRIPK